MKPYRIQEGKTCAYKGCDEKATTFVFDYKNWVLMKCCARHAREVANGCDKEFAEYMRKRRRR